MQSIQESQYNPTRNKEIGGFIIPDFKIYYKAVSIKTVCYWHKDSLIGLRNKSTEKEEYIYD